MIQKRLLRSSATSWRNVGSTEWSDTPVICVVTGIAARNGPIDVEEPAHGLHAEGQDRPRQQPELLRVDERARAGDAERLQHLVGLLVRAPSA